VTLSRSKMRLLRALEVLCERQPSVVVEFPFKVESRANKHTSNHWGPRAETTRKQRQGTNLKLRTERGLKGWAQRTLDSEGLVVRVVRVAPRELDSHDNIGHALKACTDGVADFLGVNDRDERVTFVPDQLVGEIGVRVEFYMRGAH